MDEQIKILQKDNLEKDKENLRISNELAEVKKELEKEKELNESLKRLISNFINNEQVLYNIVLGNKNEDEDD